MNTLLRAIAPFSDERVLTAFACAVRSEKAVVDWAGTAARSACVHPRATMAVVSVIASTPCVLNCVAALSGWIVRPAERIFLFLYFSNSWKERPNRLL